MLTNCCLLFSYVGKGLAFWSEQAGESGHADFKKWWSRRKVGRDHPDFGNNVFETVLDYNARHLGIYK